MSIGGPITSSVNYVKQNLFLKATADGAPIEPDWIVFEQQVDERARKAWEKYAPFKGIAQAERAFLPVL
eukprot:10299483-Lingulodinium_polyedra.AAC.1